jgi:hypothetical protein
MVCLAAGSAVWSVTLVMGLDGIGSCIGGYGCHAGPAMRD